ncbi:MAG: T9SS type A sorting domain-containing protein [Oceanihabitans sp.]|nr:T9SS type A sorting domain-containing protein [Oceanihabitans sp.]
MQNLIVNETNNIPPSNGEVLSIPLYFYDAVSFETDICNYLAGSMTFDDVASSFSFTKLVQSLVMCNMQENGDFNNFYFLNQEHPFTYAIVENGDNSKTLTIIANNGDEAIYGSPALSIEKHKVSEIKLFPNPVINSVTIDKTNAITNLKLAVFNVNGQLKISKKIATANTTNIDLTNLESGVYFFVFESEDGKTETKKIIKNEDCFY